MIATIVVLINLFYPENRSLLRVCGVSGDEAWVTLNLYFIGYNISIYY